MKNFYSIARWKRELLAAVLTYGMAVVILSDSWWKWLVIIPVLTACLIAIYKRETAKYEHEDLAVKDMGKARRHS